jgi:hypothetical protein
MSDSESGSPRQAHPGGAAAPEGSAPWTEQPQIRILVDADGCGVKEEIYRVARRTGCPVVLVANRRLRIPADPLITSFAVGSGFDAADDWIAERAGPTTIVITSDIPLAARCLRAGARVLTPDARVLDENSIGNAVAMRDLRATLREMGQITGGPRPLDQRSRSRFLQRLDELIHAIRRAG